MDEQRAVDTAKANVDASKVALEEAKQFRSIVGEEKKSAASAHKAASKELNMAAKSPNRPNAEDAAKREQVQAEMVNALQAKGEYADRLVSLRGAEVENREAEQQLAEARLKQAQYSLLSKRGLQGDLDSGKIVNSAREAEQNYAKTSQRVKEEQAATDASKEAWTAARERADASAQNARETMESPISAPKPRETMPIENLERGPTRAPATTTQSEAQKQQGAAGGRQSAGQQGAKRGEPEQGAAQSKELRERKQEEQGQTPAQPTPGTPQTTPTP